MTVETPQPRDRVRWQRTSVIEGVVEEITADGIVVRDGDGYKHLCQVEDATVEVLERADDPKVGELRREDHDDREGSAGGHSIWQVQETYDGERFWCCVYSTAPGNRDVHFLLDRMLDLPVIGAVPGTPAAEAQEQWRHCDPCECIHPPCGYVIGSRGCDSVCDQTPARTSVRVENTPDGLSIPDRQKVADLLVAGDLPGAVLAAARAGMPQGQAEYYIRDMPEWQTYLNHHGGEREPREFTKDGPEPPEDVTLVHDYRAADQPMRFAYLGRRWKDRPDLWFWQRRNVVDEDEDLGGGGTWAAMTEHAAGPLREVL